ncbi:hypothetical protein ACJ73_02282 [Blastomyces percursus]|uniref:Uncharacterized protein n=1 Tax=Blastomyces percursus TaxID=1658174 RepID=A0A1J9QCY8_9EURO|nr:hypothetical protein ACJ73_02282 [Blastomyces percursus]
MVEVLSVQSKGRKLNDLYIYVLAWLSTPLCGVYYGAPDFDGGKAVLPEIFESAPVPVTLMTDLHIPMERMSTEHAEVVE